MLRIVVVLPAPLRPSSATTSPFRRQRQRRAGYRSCRSWCRRRRARATVRHGRARLRRDTRCAPLRCGDLGHGVLRKAARDRAVIRSADSAPRACCALTNSTVKPRRSAPGCRITPMMRSVSAQRAPPSARRATTRTGSVRGSSPDLARPLRTVGWLRGSRSRCGQVHETEQLVVRPSSRPSPHRARRAQPERLLRLRAHALADVLVDRQLV